MYAGKASQFYVLFIFYLHVYDLQVLIKQIISDH